MKQYTDTFSVDSDGDVVEVASPKKVGRLSLVFSEYSGEKRPRIEDQIPRDFFCPAVN